MAAHRCRSLDLFGELFGRNTAEGAQHRESPLARVFLRSGKGEQPLSVPFALQSGFCFQTKAVALTVKPRTC